jgi:transcriptional regulator with XRE-family HTH domain
MTQRRKTGAEDQAALFRKKAFSERLRAAMDRQGLSVNELARRVQDELPGEEFNAVNLSHYRAGRSLPRPRYLSALSKAVGISATDLISPDDIRTPLEPAAIEDEAADQAPAFHIKDLADGQAWLQINQRLPWPLALRILQALKGEKFEPTKD